MASGVPANVIWRALGGEVTIAGLTLHTDDVIFPSSKGIRYIVDGRSHPNGIELWPTRDTPAPPDVEICTLEVQSGGGKSTLAAKFLDFLGGRSEAKLFNWSAPANAAYTMAMLPQRPSTVLHWKVLDLLPREPRLLDAFFAKEEVEGLLRRHLSELSGGQTARVLMASAVERLASSSHPLAYLVLDEAFEGVDVLRAHEILVALRDRWCALETAPVLRLLLINHFDPTALLAGLPARRLGLELDGWVDVSGKDETTRLQLVRIAAR